jgi:hypothetical protein
MNTNISPTKPSLSRLQFLRLMGVGIGSALSLASGSGRMVEARPASPPVNPVRDRVGKPFSDSLFGPAFSQDFPDTIRSTAKSDPTTGAGTEINYDGAAGNILAIDRSPNPDVYKTLNINGNPIKLRANGADSVTVISGGNVGIGTTNPIVLLHLKSTGNTTLTIEGLSVNSQPGIAVLNWVNSQPTMQFGYPVGEGSSRHFNFRVNGTDVLTVRGTGEVGIGTTAPAARLDVYNPSLSTDNIFRLARANATYPTIFRLGTDSAMVINSGNTDILTLKSGLVGIGTTNPTAQLTVAKTGFSAAISARTYWNSVQASNISGRKARGTEAAPTAVLNGDYLLTFSASGYGATNFFAGGSMSFFAAENWSDSAQGTRMIIFTIPNGTTSSVGRIIIEGNGNVGISTSTPAAYTLDVNGTVHTPGVDSSSDERFKKGIQPLTNVLDKLSRIRGLRFEWNEFINSVRDGYKLGKPVLGLIAQEVEKEFPELVSQWKLNDEVPDARALSYDRFVPVLIEAIKELNAKLDALAMKLNP